MEDRDDFFRRDFPIIRSLPKVGNPPGAAYRRHMDEFRQRMIGLLDNEDFMDELLTRYCLLANPLNIEFNLPFAWDRLHGLTPETQLVIKPEQKFAVNYDDEKNSALLVIRGREMKLNDIPRDVLAVILRAQGSNAVSGQMILDTVPGVDWSELREWLTELYRAGLLSHA